jgi:hypothetical protein
MISGLVAAVAVVGASAAPASACGLFQPTCGQAYVAPVYSGCNTGCGGGFAYERLPDPVQQYYYVDQGPTYSGPGDFAPVRSYQEDTVYQPRSYGYGYGYHSHSYRPWRAHTGYWGHPGMRYGYEHHGYQHRGYEHYGYRPHGYAPYRSMRYGYHGMPHQYGYHEYPLRRYY